MTDTRIVSLRRTLEQVKHCVEEALSIIVHNEDARCAKDDLWAAGELLRTKVRTDIESLIVHQEYKD